MAARKKTDSQFATALEGLEKVVERLEGGDLPLEKAVEEWEKGMQLRAACEKILKVAEQKVDVLVSKAGKTTVEDLDTDAD